MIVFCEPYVTCTQGKLGLLRSQRALSSALFASLSYCDYEVYSLKSAFNAHQNIESLDNVLQAAKPAR